MKLNLLPATVKTGAKARTAWIASILLILASVVVSAFMITSSQDRLRRIKQEVANEKPKAQAAVDVALQAETIITTASVPERNRLMSEAVLAQSAKYPALYDEVKKWIPPFYRVFSMSATPIDATTSQIQLSGTLDTYQQYADLMLALLRWKDVTGVGRDGFVNTDQIIPAITPADQTGRPRRPDEAPIPDDPLERLTYFQSRGSTEAYNPQGNYGTSTPDTRFAIPGQSVVSVTLVVTRGLQAPNVRQILSENGAPATAAAPGGAGAGAGAATTIPGAGGTGDPGLPGGQEVD